MEIFDGVVASTDSYELGEGPVWDSERQRVLWVDINVGRVHTGLLEDGRVTPVDRFDFDGTVGSVACSAAGDLIVAGQRRILYLGKGSGRRTGAQVIPGDKASRLNDGACDPAGRFLVGSMATDGRQRDDVLVRVENDTIAVIDNDLTLSNGLAWSADGTIMYSVDTTPGTVWTRSYDARGLVGPRRLFLRITDGGLPDGLCADADGNLWIAIWGAGQVRCFASTGEHVATVMVPAPNVSSVAFVGPDLDTLLITTATQLLSPQQLLQFPDSGRLFTAKVGISGLAVPAWSGR